MQFMKEAQTLWLKVSSRRTAVFSPVHEGSAESASGLISPAFLPGSWFNAD